jgi:hypothetical protein
MFSYFLEYENFEFYDIDKSKDDGDADVEVTSKYLEEVRELISNQKTD